MKKVPKELMINWDHTGINYMYMYVPVNNWAIAKEGLKQIVVPSLGDKKTAYC